MMKTIRPGWGGPDTIQGAGGLAASTLPASTTYQPSFGFELPDGPVTYEPFPVQGTFGTDRGDRVRMDQIDGPFYGLGGRDVVIGSEGSDAAYGGADGDDLSGNGGDDFLDGGAGRDVLHGGQGDDRVLGGGDNDFVDGGWGDDTLDGGEGGDTLLDGAGMDQVYGRGGDDRFFLAADWDDPGAPAVPDMIYGGSGTDTVFLTDVVDDSVHVSAAASPGTYTLLWTAGDGTAQIDTIASIEQFWIEGAVYGLADLLA